MSDKFMFNLPLDIIKSDTESNSDEGEWRIAGYASTSDPDRQGDEIIQKGLDYSDFVNYGWFNFDHSNDKILGYPDKEKCKIDSKGFYVEGTLLKDIPLAKSMWETAIALKKSNAPRKLGFSVEGKVLQRNDLGQIVKAKIYNVALTYNPVNVNATFEALCKSFTDNEEDFDKALDCANSEGSGSDLVPESLDSSLTNLSYAVGDTEDAKKHKNLLKKKLNERKEITKSELALYFQITKGLSYLESVALVDILAKED